MTAGLLPSQEHGSEAEIPKKISTEREAVYLRTLAGTRNATLAAQAAGVSRDWAYKRCERDARFAQAWLAVMARASGPPPLCGHSIDPVGSMEPLGPLRPSLSREGRGSKRVQVRRDRVGGWTAAKEARFIERLRETCSAWFASAAVGLSSVSAYRRRQVRAGFAAAWDEAERAGWPPPELPWMESALCFFEGREPPADNPVRIGSIDDVLEAMKGNKFVARRPRRRRG